MNVLVTGATGFIGSHFVQALVANGHNVVACVRDPESAQKRWTAIRCIAVDFNKDNQVENWLPRLGNIDVVINAVGIIRENRNQRFDLLHTDTPCALFRACEKAGIRKVIQVSALGADETAFSHYHLSKRAADQCLVGLSLEWVILMPSIVYGPGAKSMAFFKAMAALPLIPIIDKGQQAIQMIHVDDVVEAVLKLLHPDSPGRFKIALVGPAPITVKEIYSRLRYWLGLRKACFFSIPYSFALVLGKLGKIWDNAPVSKESVQMLQKGNTADVAPFVERFGFEPRSFEQALTETSAQEADRWHAGLFLLRPLLRLSIALVWIWTGIVSAFIYPVEQSYAMLAQVGVGGELLPVMLYGAAALDFALGVATLTAYRLYWVGLIQITIILGYSLIISFTLAEQWLHPFGPMTKNIPLVVATLIMMVLERR